MTRLVFLNGKFINEEDARVSVHDGGWLHGAGLFETMRAENGRIFRLRSHFKRLRRSAEKILHPIDSIELPDEADFQELLQRNELKSARVRLTVTTGSMLDGREPESRRLNICITTAKLGAYSSNLYEQGVQVVVSQYRQCPGDPIAGHKTTAYLPRLLGLREAQNARCAESIWFTTTQHLAEGSISNVLVVSKGVLKTPPLDTPVLPGIARGIALELAREAGLETEEKALTIDDLLDADELLLSNTIMQIMPVIRVEKHDIGEGRVGPVAKDLLERYRALVKQECSE